MKKLVCAILVLLLIPVCAFADVDLSALSFDELLVLRDQLNQEIVSRPEWKEVVVPSGTWIVGEDIPVGKYSIAPNGSNGGYVCITRNGFAIVADGIRKEEDIYAKVELLDGDIVEVERGSVLFAPPQSLGFN